MSAAYVQEVFRPGQSLKIDGDWDKPQWKQTGAVRIGNVLGPVPGFKPVVQARIMYDRDNLYLIFRVEDRYVRCITGEINGPVWEDACVEFFFAPDTRFPLKYFNLEINCAGIPLMHYNRIPDVDIQPLAAEDIQKIEIAHSLPGLIDPEITAPLTWTLEYRVPLDMLSNYSEISPPEPGVEWRANFFKIAENSSNPHYLTWSPVISEEPNFHRPQFFGLLKFR